MTLPAEGTVEGWAYRYISSRSLGEKLDPCRVPTAWADAADAASVRIEAPGRPPELVVRARGTPTPGDDALRRPECRAQLLHTFLHHELQAAELMCRAVLAYPDAPLAFRRGLIAICQDELRHMRMYADHLAHLGYAFGDFPVNDWFWRKLPPQTTRLEFVALMGIGFEGANLDHTQRFADRFRRAGDAEGAALQERVGAEEVSHVAFAAHWFEAFSGAPLSFAGWRAALPHPLTPRLLRGRPVHRAARLQAGLPSAFVDTLTHWKADP